MQYWILPCNVKQFDVCSYFLKKNTVVWKDISNMCTGDIVYIYLSAPYSRIAYKCVVINDNISAEILNINNYAKPTRPMSVLYTIKPKYVEMKYIEEYTSPNFKFKNMKLHGLGQVQVQSRVSPELKLYINSIAESETYESTQ